MPTATPTSFWVLPEWFEEAKLLYPHPVKFVIKDANTIFEAYTWCRNRLGSPDEGLWIKLGFNTKEPQIWFRNEADASLFRVFFE